MISFFFGEAQAWNSAADVGSVEDLYRIGFLDNPFQTFVSFTLKWLLNVCQLRYSFMFSWKLLTWSIALCYRTREALRLIFWSIYQLLHLSTNGSSWDFVSKVSQYSIFYRIICKVTSALVYSQFMTLPFFFLKYLYFWSPSFSPVIRVPEKGYSCSQLQEA
jgi:hypothetical protein